MKLYVCWGTWGPAPWRPGGKHPCGAAYAALREAGHDPEVVRSYGLGVLPDALANRSAGRRRAKELTGSSMVPVLELDDGTAIAGSETIARWAREHPVRSPAPAGRGRRTGGGTERRRAAARVAPALVKVGYVLSCEEHGPADLVRQARMAEAAGFDGLWISDHFHPWNEAQGQSPFVWSVVGALAEATERVTVTTGVTCPTVRIHPAIIAQAAATSQVMLEGRFQLGVGSGEALNEHILGDPWPAADVRLEMLEEAVEIIRKLWTGAQIEHAGRHYRVENARIYTLPDEPPPILVSGFGPKSVEVAARIGDGYCLTTPDRELIARFRARGGGEKPVQAGTKVCYGPDEAEARATAHRLWPNEVLPGELAMILPTPAHVEQATELITEEMVADTIPCGPDLERHLAALAAYADAGVDELYIAQIGGGHEAFFAAYADHILPRLRRRTSRRRV